MQKNVQDTVKLNIFSGGKERKVFVTISQNPAANTRPVGVAVAAPAPLPQTIAVAATSGDLRAQVSPSFSTAPAFILYDPVSRQFSTLSNPGAGTLTSGQQSTSMLVKTGVTAVIVGSIGPASLNRLNAAGIRVYTGAIGSVREMIEQFFEGRLVPAVGSVVPNQNLNAQAVKQGAAKVAVASQGRTLASPVATEFATALYFIIYDTQNGQVEVVAAQPELGINSVQTAHLLVDHGASAVITGNASSSSIKTLSSLGIFAFTGVSGRGDRAIQMYQNGQLRAATVASPRIAPQAANPNAG
jgi:predicted Fe-Mo cluster-binding NifX family protein